MPVLLPDHVEADGRINWRLWLYNMLVASGEVFGFIAPDQILAAGSLEGGKFDHPFLVIRLGFNAVELNDADEPFVSSQSAAIWVHDEPGSYKRIDHCLVAIRNALAGQVDEAVACLWQGDSGELADPDQGTICRTGNYRLIGRTV